MDQEAELRRFLKKVMKPDAVSVIRLITLNAGEVIGSLVVAKMFEDFLEEQKSQAKHITSGLSYENEKDKPHALWIFTVIGYSVFLLCVDSGLFAV